VSRPSDYVVRRITVADIDGADPEVCPITDVDQWGVFRVDDRAPRGESGHLTSYYAGPFKTRREARAAAKVHT
jgi:hypothetical protein